MPSKPGIKQAVFCDKGTLATTPVNPVLMGFRNGAKLNISPHKGIKEFRGGELRNMTNFKFEVESLQFTMFLLKVMLGWIDCNCDIQLLTSKQTSAGAQDVFKFIGNNYAGIDFEATFNNDKRSFKATVERAMPYALASTFIDQADSDTAVAITGLTNTAGEDTALTRAPYLLALEAPKATSLYLSTADILERSLSIKTKGKKSQDNTTIVDYLTFVLKFKTRDASVAKMITQRSRDMGTSVLTKEGNSGAFYDVFDFAPSTLIQTEEVEINDDDRFIELTFQRDVDVFDVSFLFGAANGGDAADTVGKKGGTMKIGY